MGFSNTRKNPNLVRLADGCVPGRAHVYAPLSLLRSTGYRLASSVKRKNIWYFGGEDRRVCSHARFCWDPAARMPTNDIGTFA
jgi:hypothetical protein